MESKTGPIVTALLEKIDEERITQANMRNTEQKRGSNSEKKALADFPSVDRQ